MADRYGRQRTNRKARLAALEAALRKTSDLLEATTPWVDWRESHEAVAEAKALLNSLPKVKP